MGSAFFLATSSGGFDNRYFSCLPQASFGTGFSSASSFHCISGNYFCATAIIGFTGHFEQNSDFFLRNPIYSNLVRYDWPLVFPDGNLLVYYFGFWLPPALASKFFPLGWSPYLLWLWSLTGMVLFTGTMSFYFKSRIWIFILVLFSLAPLNVVINKTGIVYFLLGVKEVGQDLHWNCCMAQLVCTFNHFIPCLVFGGVFINRMLDKGSLLFFSSLLLLCSPFGGIAFLPYLGGRHLSGQKFLFRHVPFLERTVLFPYGVRLRNRSGDGFIHVWSRFHERPAAFPERNG